MQLDTEPEYILALRPLPEIAGHTTYCTFPRVFGVSPGTVSAARRSDVRSVFGVTVYRSHLESLPEVAAERIK